MSTYFSPDDIDPATGLPKKKKQQNQARNAWAGFGPQIQSSLAQNPQAGFGPSPQIDYGFGTLGNYRLPNAPDYKSLIEQQLAPLRMELGAQGVADTSQLTAATQRALTLGGIIPDFGGTPPAGLNLDLFNQAVTPEVRQMAQQNTDAGLSIAARQAKAFKDQVRQIKNQLAARGALRSGEAGHALSEAQLTRDQASFDTSRELVEFIAGLQAGLAERERQRRLQEAQAAGEAETQVRAAFPAQAVPPGGYGSAPPISAQTGGATAPRANVPGYTPMPGEPSFQGPVGPIQPVDIAALLANVKPPKPGDIRLPGGGGSLNYFAR